MTQAYNLAILANAVNTSGQLNIGTNATGTLPVANGGTGASSLTANNVLLGNGTSALQAVAPSTAGNILTSNGSTWVSQAFSGGGNLQFSLALRGSATNSSGTPLVFNSTGSCTWTCPSGVTRIKLIVVGGGGAGGGGVNTNPGTTGGNGGVGIGFYTVTPGTAYAVTIGAGASGGGSMGTGGTGGSSSFGSLLTATGGTGGVREYGQRTNGSASLGTIINISTQYFSPLELGRLSTTYPNSQNGGSQSAQTYTISFNFSAGSAGSGANGGEGSFETGGGSVSGAVYIEYVGS